MFSIISNAFSGLVNVCKNAYNYISGGNNDSDYQPTSYVNILIQQQAEAEFKRLNDIENEQIESDYQLAVKLAREESDYQLAVKLAREESDYQLAVKLAREESDHTFALEVEAEGIKEAEAARQKQEASDAVYAQMIQDQPEFNVDHMPNYNNEENILLVGKID